MQSINFLKSLPQNTNRLSAALMGLIVFAGFVLLVITSLIVLFKQYQANAKLTDTKNSLAIVQKGYHLVAAEYPLLASGTPLINQVQELDKKYQTKQNEFNTLKHLIVRPGFSEYMLGLAQTTPNTLWLNKIQVNHDTSNVSLSGYSVRPDSVSELMSRLLITPAYKDIIFNLFFVKTIKNHPYVKFSIATKELGAEEEVETSDQTTNKPKE